MAELSEKDVRTINERIRNIFKEGELGKSATIWKFQIVREEGTRSDELQGIFGNLDPSVFDEPAYPTIESKASHLLYFVVKNHPFSDGNKCSGAFLFVDFLHRNGWLLNAQGEALINDTRLAAITLLVAESDPKQRET